MGVGGGVGGGGGGNKSYLGREPQPCRRVGEIDAQAHTGQRQRVGEDLDPRVEMERSLEAAKSNDQGAGGEENDEGQAHEYAVGDPGSVYALYKGKQGQRNHRFPSGWTTTAASAATARAGTTIGTTASTSPTGTSSILLSAYNASYR